MNSILSRILVLSTALVVASPPGWCCILPTPSEKKARSPVPHCPHCPRPQPQPKKESPRDSKPKIPLSSCCCDHETLPPDPKVAPDNPGLAVPTLVLDGEHLPLGVLVAESFERLLPTPPLQILHCVWRC